MNDLELKNWVNKNRIGNKFRSIVIDFTLMLPGGENGGAKVFLLELVKKLSLSSPNTQFTLLTKFLSHEELSSLDAVNVRRLLVVNKEGPLTAKEIIANNPRFYSLSLSNKVVEGFRNKACNILGGLGSLLPEQFILRRAVNRLVRVLNSRLQMKSNESILQGLKADLLLCPFTAMPYYEEGVPAVCIVHDLQHKTYPQFFHPNDVEVRNKIFDDACVNASQITAVSEYTRNVAMFHSKLKKDRIRTNYLRMSQRVVAHEASLDDINRILDFLGLIKNKFLLYPANFWAHKNHEMLITAYVIARETGLPIDIKLVCTGHPTPRMDHLINLVKSLGLEEFIVFPGYVSTDELGVLMTSCAGVIFPSLYEGFGLPVIEAMANNIPVACSNLTALPEIVGSAAITFNPNIPAQISNAMIEIVCNQDKVKSLKLLGRERAQLFADSTQMTKEYWELFESALSITSHNFSKPSVSIVSLIRQDSVYLKSYFGQIENLSESICKIDTINLVHDVLKDGKLSPLLSEKSQDSRIILIPELSSDIQVVDFEEKVAQWAAIANQGIESALRANSDYILFLESDLCFPFDLLDQLAPLNLDIVAPLIYLGINFYDSWGFRDLDGNKIYQFSAQPGKGFFDGPIELSSVGSCVLFKSDIFKKGVRFRLPYETGLLAGVCMDARELGYRVWVDPTTCISHPTSSWRRQIWTITTLNITFMNGVVLHYNYAHLIAGAYDFFVQAWLSEQVTQIDQLKSVKFRSNWECNQENRSIRVSVIEVGD
jgi:glycosyltransferase involved in cell wall biosynthesis